MGRFFNLDSPVMNFLSRLADLMILNICFLITCIPVFTIGASYTALLNVTMKMAKNEESYIIKSYFKQFKDNFKNSTIFWIGICVTGVVIFVDFRFSQQLEGSLAIAFQFVMSLITIMVVMVFNYVFALESTFANTRRNTVKNSLLFGIRYLPFTVIITIINAIPFICFLVGGMVFVYAMPVFLLIGFALLALLNGFIYRKLFDPVIKMIKDAATENVEAEKLVEGDADELAKK